MKRNSLVVKGIASGLLILFFYQYTCAFWCAIPAAKCCDEKSEKACCKGENHHEKDGDDCQKSHLAFFENIGISNSENHLEIQKPFKQLVSKIESVYAIPQSLLFASSNKLIQLFYPPPKSIRILIQSFQI